MFICYNRGDQAPVQGVVDKLKAAGINVWLDVELPPGALWQAEPDKAIDSIPCAAVFIGRSDRRPWQDLEIYAFIPALVRRRARINPVILSGSKRKPRLPTSLNGMNWVDFRCAAPDPMTQLIWGITGTKPDHSKAS